ncbi:hypothetical protein BHE74_00015976, partial [Ensete ventricosum]
HVELKRTLDAVSSNCHCIERLLFESSDTGGSRHLKFVDFSTSYSITGTFLSTQLISEVLKQRPELCLLAKFPPEGSLIDIDLIADSEISSGTSSLMLYNLAFDSYLTNSSENSYSSDQGSGNEDVPDLNFPYDEDIFDELEFL